MEVKSNIEKLFIRSRVYEISNSYCRKLLSGGLGERARLLRHNVNNNNSYTIW